MGGRAKSFLDVHGERIIDRQLRVLRPMFAEILISIGAHDPGLFQEFGLPLIPDLAPDQGPLGGLLAVLSAARADHVVIVGCDMPYISGAALHLLVRAPIEADVVVPVVPDVSGRPEPLFARYSRRCAAAIQARLDAGERKATSFFPDVTVQEILAPVWQAIDPTLGFLSNCNTPEDLV